MNLNLLKYYIKENHDTVSTLALALGVHYVTLTLKLNGKREFNKHEIEFISKRYNFNAEQTMKIFFWWGSNKWNYINIKKTH